MPTREAIKSAITDNVRHRLSRGHYSKQLGHYGVYHWGGLNQAADSILALFTPAKGDAEVVERLEAFAEEIVEFSRQLTKQEADELAADLRALLAFKGVGR
jgi:hypothetical protein